MQRCRCEEKGSAAPRRNNYVRRPNATHLRGKGMAKIIQLVLTDDDAKWQGRLLGLGDDGITYECNHQGRWEPFIPKLGYFSDETQHIRELGLSTRAVNCLVSAGVETVSELRLMSRRELLKIPKLGKRSVTEIIDKLHTLNKG